MAQRPRRDPRRTFTVAEVKELLMNSDSEGENDYHVGDSDYEMSDDSESEVEEELDTSVEPQPSTSDGRSSTRGGGGSARGRGTMHGRGRKRRRGQRSLYIYRQMAYNSSNMTHLAPNPNHTIGCQDLLTDGACVHSGWLRRQSLRNRFKIFAWPQVYVVISGGCVYCYSNEMGRKPASAFSLYGYDRVYRAGEVAEKEATWAFKLVHVNSDYRSYLFSSSSEKEMVFWMSLFKTEMLRANGKLPRSQGDGQSFDVATYQESGSEYCGSVSSQDYMDIESNIYEDSSLCVMPSDYRNKKENDDSDEEMDVMVTTRKDLQDRPPQAPPVPQRPPKMLPVTSAKNQAIAAVTQELKSMTLSSPQQPAVTRRPAKTPTKEAEKPVVDRNSKQFRSRGSPDGSSVKEDEQHSEAKDFWSSIFFYGGKEKASDIIRQMPDDGVYLVRVNEDKSMVLHVYADHSARKFQIFKVGNKFTLKKDSGDMFKGVEDLIYFYYTNVLPSVDVNLSMCYVEHPQYTSIRLT